jgi:hypothetical protein
VKGIVSFHKVLQYRLFCLVIVLYYISKLRSVPTVSTEAWSLGGSYLDFTFRENLLAPESWLVKSTTCRSGQYLIRISHNEALMALWIKTAILVDQPSLFWGNFNICNFNVMFIWKWSQMELKLQKIIFRHLLLYCRLCNNFSHYDFNDYLQFFSPEIRQFNDSHNVIGRFIKLQIDKSQSTWNFCFRTLCTNLVWHPHLSTYCMLYFAADQKPLKLQY